MKIKAAFNIITLFSFIFIGYFIIDEGLIAGNFADFNTWAFFILIFLFVIGTFLAQFSKQQKSRFFYWVFIVINFLLGIFFVLGKFIDIQ